MNRNKKYYIGLIAIMCVGIACQSPNKNKTKQEESTEIQVSEGAKALQVNMANYFDSALNGNIEPVQEAVESGIDIESRNENGYTALMLAAYNGHHHILKFLIEKGAKIDAVESLNRTALMFACTGPFEQAVEVLIKAGADVNAIDGHENWTPVMFAAGEGQLQVIKLLVANGADLSKVDTDGESALDFAKSKGHTATIEYLQANMK
ncbi:ankyrin repeat domain-containing protein [Carboxylicivirga marina]|uniref:ankyrin repeat domain-containing protein n=1 Tax=Carboxylicivirga marina TaxID=2800988 RepID=UPI0025967F1B|nr:ankyrin repeat domain-containing protein [uncultured Carboxylicivirga sp.]